MRTVFVLTVVFIVEVKSRDFMDEKAAVALGS